MSAVSTSGSSHCCHLMPLPSLDRRFSGGITYRGEQGTKGMSTGWDGIHAQGDGIHAHPCTGGSLRFCALTSKAACSVDAPCSSIRSCMCPVCTWMVVYGDDVLDVYLLQPLHILRMAPVTQVQEAGHNLQAGPVK
jgi:hypothetical protein